MFKKSRMLCRAVACTLSIVALCAGTAVAKEKAKGADFDLAKTSAFMHEMEGRPDFPVAMVLANDYVYSVLALGEKMDAGKKSAVIAYIKGLQGTDGGFVSDKSDKSASLLYTDIAVETLGYLNSLKTVDAAKLKAFVASLKNTDGGFGFSAEAKASSLAGTFCAVRVLKAFNSLASLDKARTAEYVKRYEKKDGGFGSMQGAGAANARNTYMAAYILNAVGSLDQASRKNALKYLATTPYAGKSAERADLNEQLYAILAAKELKAAEKINKKYAAEFMKQLYIPVNGGFGPLEGYGSTPDSTTTALRVLSETGKLKRAGLQAAKK